MESLEIAPQPEAVEAPGRAAVAVRFADLVELTKPRITSMVAVTAAAGFVMASPGRLDWLLLAHALLGTSLVASGAAALNQVVERGVDARMRRTARRPLPAGRLHPDVALLWAVSLSVVGVTWLALAVNLLTALLGALTLAGYVFVYTPMKRLSSLATVVGAVPGAVPPMMGWAAARDLLEPGAWALFAILFLWQMPHFLAIAWMYRADYERGGMPMLPVVDPDGTRTGRQAVLYAAALVPVALLPTPLGLTGPVYFIGALLFSLAFLWASWRFQQATNSTTAKKLLLTSVVYLPALLAVMFLDRLL
ncbi:MAG TPA: heme o synthase [Thermoanaerobaculia bacterium]|nr:heme o synthase [Thermoanaerobaculia bacterium]